MYYAGGGGASLVFAGIAFLPYGWRSLYVIGSVPLFLVAYMRRRLPETKHVLHSNLCDIGLVADARTGRVIVVSAIDNLVKGASGQAVQCFNLMAGLDERAGLWIPGLFP